MTFLELVNQVLIRLREPTVTDVNANKYTKMIAAFVNDAKRAVEDATKWGSLRRVINLTTEAGVNTYVLDETTIRSTVYSVNDRDGGFALKRDTAENLIRDAQLYGQSGIPSRWGINRLEDTGELRLRLEPSPAGERSYFVNAYLESQDLINNSDIIRVPAEPVYLHAYAHAVRERGEDSGATYRESMDTYRRVLARYLILNNSVNGGPQQWQVL